VRQPVDTGCEGLDAESVFLAADLARRHWRRLSDLEVGVTEIRARLRNVDRETANLRFVELPPPSRHRRLREAVGDALRDFGDRIAMLQCDARERRALRGALELLAMADAAV